MGRWDFVKKTNFHEYVIQKARRIMTNSMTRHDWIACRSGRLISLIGCRRRVFVAMGLLVALLLVVTLPTPATGQTVSPCNAARDGDQLWMVSTRSIGCCDLNGTPALSVERYDAQDGWQSAQLDELIQSDRSDSPLVIFIHGNWTGFCAARSEGLHVYHCLTSNALSDKPIRFVIWSWPSDRMGRPLQDVRAKAHRTEIDGYLLASFLKDIAPDQPTCLIGYSFGARIATGALHLLGGGTLSGRVLSARPEKTVRPRVVLFAAAVHNYWLRPGCYHEMALHQIDNLLSLYSSCDHALRRYHVLERGAHPQALGYTGMCTNDLGELACRIRQQDVCCLVGRSHEISEYLRHCELCQLVQRYVFWLPVDGSCDADMEQAVAAN